MKSSIRWLSGILISVIVVGAIISYFCLSVGRDKNWKTYNSKTGKYSVEYKADETVRLIGNDGSVEFYVSGQPSKRSITVFHDSNETLDDVIRGNHEMVERAKNSELESIRNYSQEEQSVFVDGVRAFKVTTGSGVILVSLINNHLSYLITGSVTDSDFDHFLASFRLKK